MLTLLPTPLLAWLFPPASLLPRLGALPDICSGFAHGLTHKYDKAAAAKTSTAMMDYRP